MATTFGTRVRAAMASAGLSNKAQLGKRCGVSPQMAGRWLLLEEPRLSAAHLLALSRGLNVRMYWLMTGLGFMHLATQIERTEETARRIFDGLPTAKLELWLSLGSCLLESLPKPRGPQRRRNGDRPNG